MRRDRPAVALPRRRALRSLVLSALLLAPFAPDLGAAELSPDAPVAEWRSLEKDGLLVRHTPADAAVAGEILVVVAEGRTTVEGFFGGAFPRPFAVSVFPGRAELTAFWRREWKEPDFSPQCWMVASGSAETLSLLSPRVFGTEACEHDPSDAAATRLLLVHELVHVFHAQTSPSADFDLEEIAWFVEGLATFASGQLSDGRLTRAREALGKGQGPKRLADAWSGPNRYGFAGSLVAYVDGRWGRKTTVALLRETTPPGLLGRLGVGEAELMDGWRRWVAAGGAR